MLVSDLPDVARSWLTSRLARRVVKRQGVVAFRRRLRVSGGVAAAKRARRIARWMLVSRIAPRGRIACPRLLPVGEQQRICATRLRSGWGPRLIAGETGHPHATVWRALRRAGISRRPREPREQVRLYEWPCPGDLLHIDTKRFVRFSRSGHAVTGVRHRSGKELRMHVGYEWVHSIVDDHSRYASCELHRDEKATTVTGFVERAFAAFAALGITPSRLISDNASTYTDNRALAELLERHGVRQLLIPPHRPQVNGKVEPSRPTRARRSGRR